MSQAKVVLYSSDYCGYCWRAKSLLDAKGIGYEENNVDGKPELRERMRQLSQRTSVPQIWIGETHIGGCSELYALEQSGELDRYLNPGTVQSPPSKD